jgi:hypothetical protein
LLSTAPLPSPSTSIYCSATRKPIGYRRNEQEKGNPTLNNQIPRSMQSIPTIEKKNMYARNEMEMI